MMRETVGYRRLYQALGCSVAGAPDLRLVFPFDSSTSACIYLGPTPTFGVTRHDIGDGFLSPDRAGVVSIRHDEAPHKEQPAFYTEICCTIEIEVPDELAASLHQPASEAQQAILRMVEPHRGRLQRITDFLAGVFGLRFHRQFVIKPICENLYAVRGQQRILGSESPSLERLEGLTLNATGIKSLQQLTHAISQDEPELKDFAGSVLHWLLRAWTERDSVSRFMAFFIPLEMILSDYKPVATRPEWTSLRELVSQHVPADQAQGLLGFLEHQQRREQPSLVARFVSMAREAAQPSADGDIASFKRFHRMRNEMQHRGDPKPTPRVTVGDHDVTTLEDLAERYVCYRFFKDMRVYESEFRPVRPISPA